MIFGDSGEIAYMRTVINSKMGCCGFISDVYIRIIRYKIKSLAVRSQITKKHPGECFYRKSETGSIPFYRSGI